MVLSESPVASAVRFTTVILLMVDLSALSFSKKARTFSTICLLCDLSLTPFLLGVRATLCSSELLELPAPSVDNDLCVEDFVLGIQTPLQAEIMKRFGKNFICADAIHGTNGYDLMLITVIVIDEYGEGFPVAWCISNSEDQLLLVNFFNALKMRVGVIKPAWFMSDLT